MKVVVAAPQRGASVLLVAALVFIFAAPTTARADPACARAEVREPRHAWPAPLDRLVTLHAHDLVLRDALDRVAAAARLRISYSPDGLPLDRSVCVSYDSVAAGEVLTSLLTGTSLSPMSAGDDQVVLTPVATVTPRHAERDSAPSVSVLERVVVTSTSLRPGSPGVVTSTDVLDESQLARRGSGHESLSEALDGAVPGLWVWDQAPSSLIARYGSLRGASSFGVSYPKVYIDGVEVANPALLTELNPDAVDHVEVIRGPEGAALYGGDAIGGVINIVMRHDPGSSDGIGQFRGTAGMTHSAFAQRPVLTQDHAVEFRGGSDERSASLSVNVGSVGSYIPGAGSWDAGADAGFRLLGSRTMLTGTARFYSKEAGIGVSPFATAFQSRIGQATTMNRDRWRDADSRDADSRDADDRSWVPNAATSQIVREYTLGTTALFASDDRWTHSLTVGLDGYSLSGGVAAPLAPAPTAVDSALLATPGTGNRATFRASSVARLSSPSGSAVVTVAAEHSTLWEQSSDGDAEPFGRSFEAEPSWQSNTGVSGQLEASFRDALFATGGLRVEHYAGLAASDGLVSLPTVGGAVVHGFGPITAKLRASYGKAARSPGAAVRVSWLEHEPAVAGRLVPEEQSGLEGGLDLFVGSTAALRVTRFDQHAYSLIQPVAIASAPSATDPNATRLLYQLQNVGEIANRGWELESTVAAGRLSMTGTFSLVDSRVRRLSETYTGDLRPGDRMLAVPARSGGLTAAWKASTWSTSLTATRVSNWVNYDGIGLALASSTATSPIVGEQLRSFWRLYPGVTRLDASISRDAFQRFTLVLTARNLLDVQRGEPDDLTVVPGRSLTAGVAAKF